MPKPSNEKTKAQLDEQARRQAEAAKRTKARLANKPETPEVAPNPVKVGRQENEESNGGKKSKPKSVKK
jgi:hypothetical protein